MAKTSPTTPNLGANPNFKMRPIEQGLDHKFNNGAHTKDQKHGVVTDSDARAESTTADFFTTKAGD